MNGIKDSLQQKYTLLKTFWHGFQSFEQTGQTPTEAYYAMRNLYVQTNGRFNDVFQLIYGRTRRNSPMPFSETSQLIGISQPEIDKIVRQLQKDGCYIFPQKIEDRYLDALMKFALETPAIMQSDKKTATNESDETPFAYPDRSAESPYAYFSAENPIASKYIYPEQLASNNPTVQMFMSDPALLNIAQKYIGSQAIIDSVTMWWTTPFGSGQPSSTLAQLYHFDMDRIKFLKFFVYLTDVDAESGPHCYIRGSCQRKPQTVLADRRFKDEELKEHFQASDFLEFTAPRGTVLAVDTRGFHKAKVPTAGNRLILELELASCLFGQTYPKTRLEIKNDQLKKAVENNPVTYSNFQID